jgi:type VI protein secretion system component VasF
MSETPTQRGPPPKLNRALTAHERRARLIAQLHKQAMATTNDLSAQHKAIKASNARRVRAVAWTSLAGGFIVALAAILALLAMME